MENIESYIKWRGDVSFQRSTVNDIDNLALCMLSYLDMSPVLNSRNQMPLKEVFDKLNASGNVKIKNADNNYARYRGFMTAAVHSARFGNIVVSDYMDIFDKEKNLQFAAMVFHLGNDTAYIAFRGTDETLIGWKEDFIMSFSKTAAQTLAEKYVKAIMLKYPSNQFYIGGHSKGGSLALYAATKLTDDELFRTEHIYINDGPGMAEEVFKQMNIERIRPKTTKIVPEFCVIGKLFDTQFYNCKIVKSSAIGILQHDLITWELEAGDLRLCDQNSPESIWINEAFDRWLSGISQGERQKLVNDLFDTLTSNGAKTIADLSQNDQFGFEQVLKLLLNETQPTTRRKIGSFPVVALFDRTLHRIRNGKFVQTIKNSALSKPIALIVFGLLFCILPESFILVITALACLGLIGFQIYTTIKYLRKSNWDFYQERTRVYISIALLMVYIILLIKQNALFILGSSAFGIGFLCTAYNYVERAQKHSQKPEKIWYIIRAILFTFLGLSILILPISRIVFYSIAVGIVLMADGVFRLVRWYTQNKKQ